MATRSVLGLIYTLQAMQRLDVPVDEILRHHGLALDQLDPSAEMERALELAILDEAADYLDDPMAGFKMGDQFSLAGYGPFTMLLMTCKTAWHAFQTGIQYQELGYMFARMSLEPGEHQSTLKLEPMVLPPHLRRFLIERDFVGTYRLILDIQNQMGIDLSPSSVSLAIKEPDPEQKKKYQQYFRCPVSFGGEYSTATIPNEYLKTPFPSANKTAHALYLSQCDQLLAQRQTQTGELASKVRRHLAMFTGTFPSAAQVADAFSIAERSFRRQLSQEDTSFRKLLEQTREKKACQWLAESKMPVETIAQQLGYAEAASFIHAFQRWTGKTPAAWRKQPHSNNPTSL